MMRNKRLVSLISTNLQYHLFSLSHDDVIILDLDAFFSLKVNCLFMNYSFSWIHVYTLNYSCFSVSDHRLQERKRLKSIWQSCYIASEFSKIKYSPIAHTIALFMLWSFLGNAWLISFIMKVSILFCNFNVW